MIGAGAPPAVPGLVLHRRLGGGRYGEVWTALDLGAVRTVAVQVGRPAGGSGAAAREAALLRRIEHENVARLRAVLDLPDGRRAVVLDLVPGGDLAALIARRGPLPTGEVVTVAIALARALEHIHALGFVHGRLTPHDVLFAPDGRPVLAGVGIPALLAPTTDTPPTYPTPADDVRALGAVLRDALTGGMRDATVPGPLAPAVALCLAGDPDVRPTPTRVATMAWDAAPALPVDLGGGMPEPSPPAEPFAEPRGPVMPDGGEPGRRRWRRWSPGVAVGAVASVLVVGALTLLTRAVESHPEPASTSSASANGLDDARSLVSTLAAARARALGTLSTPGLAAVDAPDSAALAADRAFIGRLRQAGTRLSGLGFEVGDARVLEVGGDRALVQTTVTTSGHLQLRADGSVARRVPRGAPRTVRLSLVRTAAGWRIAADG